MRTVGEIEAPWAHFSPPSSGAWPKRGSMPDVAHRKLTSTRSSPLPAHPDAVPRRLSDNFLTIPDHLQFRSVGLHLITSSFGLRRWSLITCSSVEPARHVQLIQVHTIRTSVPEVCITRPVTLLAGWLLFTGELQIPHSTKNMSRNGLQTGVALGTVKTRNFSPSRPQ